MKKYAFLLLLFLIPVLGQAQVQTACSVTFGNNLSFTNNGTAGFFQLTGAVASAPGTVFNTLWFLLSTDSGATTLTEAIYDSAAGSPTTLIEQATNVVVNSTGWFQLPLVTPVTVTSGHTYFLGGMASSSEYQLTNGLSGQLCGYIAPTWSATCPSPIIGYTVLASTDQWNMFADYCVPATNTPTPGNTATMTPTQTATCTATCTATQTATQTVTVTPTLTSTPGVGPPPQMTLTGLQGILSFFPLPPVSHEAAVWFGDSITAGTGASPLSDSWASLTSTYIASINPGVQAINNGIGGITSSGYDYGMSGVLALIAGYGYGPIGYATVFLGMNDFDTDHTSCNACTENAGPTEVTNKGVTYYNELVDMVNQIMAYNATVGSPGVVPNIVVCSVPDPNNEGLGTASAFNPSTPVTLFRSEAVSVVSYFQGLGDNNVQFVDVYNIMYQQPTWFVNGDVHPNNTGHSAIALGYNGYKGTESKLTGH